MLPAATEPAVCVMFIPLRWTGQVMVGYHRNFLGVVDSIRQANRMSKEPANLAILCKDGQFQNDLPPGRDQSARRWAAGK